MSSIIVKRKGEIIKGKTFDNLPQRSWYTYTNDTNIIGYKSPFGFFEINDNLIGQFGYADKCHGAVYVPIEVTAKFEWEYK